MSDALVPRRESKICQGLSRIGIGALHLSLDPRPSTADAIAVLHTALSSGITLIDTADSYCRDELDKHHNETLVRQALDSFPGSCNAVVVATKGGMIRPHGQWIVCGDPKYLEAAIQRSHQALGGNRPIDIWQYHVPDPHYDFAESFQPALAAVQSGLVRQIGLSNVSLDQVKRARTMIDIVSVQNPFNLWNRDAEFNGLLEYCDRNGIVFFAWSPLGGRQQHRELQRISVLARLASERNTSIYSIALAWLMSKSMSVVPIPGTVNPTHIRDWVDACHLELTIDEIYRIDCSTYITKHNCVGDPLSLDTLAGSCPIC